MESHTVDIRADLYSLGCTFYLPADRRVPFPGGTLIEKVYKHQLERTPAGGGLAARGAACVAAVVEN